MDSFLPHAFTREVVDRWGAANPRLGLLLPLLNFTGIITDVDVVYARGPAGWIEWFWSLFGYTYQEIVPEVHLDWVRIFVVIMVIVLALISLLVLTGKAVARTAIGVYGLTLRVRAAISHYSEKVADIFRVQASSVDPGSRYCLVPYPTVPESTMPGSNLVRYTMPTCQAILAYKDGDRTRVVGCAIRVRTPTGEDYLLTPLHVWAVFDRDFPLVHVRGQGDFVELDSRSIVLKGTVVSRDVVSLDTDVVAVRISDSEASRIGVSVAKIGAAGMAGYVRIVGPTNMGTTGTLRSDASVFGHYVYSGSTEAGFSGAAYTNGTVVFAMHLCGGQRNFGYSIRLAYVTLLFYRKIKGESTEQWIEDMVRKKGERIIVDTSWQDVDTVRIRVRWDYHVVEKDKLYRTVGEDNPNIQYRDFRKLLDDGLQWGWQVVDRLHPGKSPSEPARNERCLQLLENNLTGPLKEIWEEAKGSYVWPDRNSDALRSLAVHLSHFTRISIEADDHPDPTNEQLALAICEQALMPAVYDLPDDYDSYERFLEVVRNLDFTSTPGYPYCQEKPTIGEWLGYDGFEGFDQFQLQRLWYDVEQFLKGENDPIYKAFIKQEAHTRVKAEQGRWRLIVCFPLNVQVAWHMHFRYGNGAMLKASYDIPAQFGFQLTRGNWKLYYKQWTSKRFNAGTDVSAYDFGVTWRKVKDIVVPLRARMTRGRRKAEWLRGALRLYEKAYCDTKILMPNGELVAILVHGAEKSGSPNTISDNSILRFHQAVHVNLMLGIPVYPLGSYVGDDALEHIPGDVDQEHYIDAYRRLGWVLKKIDSGLDFVGHRFTPQGPVPLYVGKHLWNFVYCEPDIVPDYLDSMCRLYVHSPHYWIWETLAEQMGVRVMSQDYYKVWYDTEHCEFYEQTCGAFVVARA